MDQSQISHTRDVFQARLDHFYKDLASKFIEKSDIALASAIVGEIGNNCFDHNLGQWKDTPGCWLDFGVDDSLIWIVIADRGQGVLASLKRVEPSLKNDQQALETAFHKRISGRSPEQRGNGLKFVRNVINGNKDRAIFFASGESSIGFGGLLAQTHQLLEEPLKKGRGLGTFALVIWK